jgi:hypothetical protein
MIHEILMQSILTKNDHCQSSTIHIQSYTIHDFINDRRIYLSPFRQYICQYISPLKSLLLLLLHLQVLFVHFLLCRPLLGQLLPQLLVYLLLTFFLHCLVPLLYLLLCLLEGGNAVLVELSVLRVLAEHFGRVDPHLLQLLFFFLTLLLLFLSNSFHFLFSLLYQDLLSLEFPNAWLTHLLVFQSHTQVHHRVISEIVANIQNLLEI